MTNSNDLVMAPLTAADMQAKLTEYAHDLGLAIYTIHAEDVEAGGYPSVKLTCTMGKQQYDITMERTI